MTVETMAAVLHHSRAKGTAKLLLVGIANHDGDGGAWPTIGKLAIYLNVHPRNVQRAMEKLEACPMECPRFGTTAPCDTHLGEVFVHLQRGGTLDSHPSDYERPNRYDVLVECPEGCAGGKHHKPRPGWRRLWKREGGLPAGTYVPVDNGVASAPGGGASATRPGGASATHNQPLNPPPPGSASTTGHAKVDGWCDGCGLTFVLHLRAIERGTYDVHNFRARGKRA